MFDLYECKWRNYYFNRLVAVKLNANNYATMIPLHKIHAGNIIVSETEKKRTIATEIVGTFENLSKF